MSEDTELQALRARVAGLETSVQFLQATVASLIPVLMRAAFGARSAHQELARQAASRGQDTGQHDYYVARIGEAVDALDADLRMRTNDAG